MTGFRYFVDMGDEGERGIKDYSLGTGWMDGVT